MFLRTRNLLPALIFLFVFALAALARVVLCPRCGHEAEPAATICAHCQQALTPDAETPVAGPTSSPAPSLSAVARATVETELAAARAALDGDRPALAWWRARNLAGLMALSPASADLAAARVEVERGALAALRERDRECPVCKGDGGMTLLFVTVQGDPSRQKAPGQSCPACKGLGRWPARPTEDQLAGAFAQGQRDFLAAMRDAGWKASGPAWLPPGLTNLTARQTAQARSAVAGPCGTCRGLGFLGCDTCRGAGRLPCSDAACVSGRVVCPDCQGMRRRQEDEDGRSITRRCATCRQTGVAECAACEGRSVLVCDDCEGRGERRCDTCDGRGERALCTGCSGEGVRACRRCKGSGTYRDAVCAVCRGEGDEVCSSCQGDGHGKR
jgi:hypothetical protein